MRGPLLTRREYLKLGGSALALGAFSPLEALGAEAGRGIPEERGIHFVKEARWYRKLEGGRVLCELCPRNCRVGDSERGYCGVRENRGGSYHTLVWGNPCATNADPIEKKPFFHVRPGSLAASLATAGCNFHCKFCQNWNISQRRPEQVPGERYPPERVVRWAKAKKADWIAFTYSEPTVFSEYMYDTAVLARKHGVGTVMVSNGFINEKPMRDLCEVLSAVKVDLKAFTEEFYRKVCGGRLKPVLDTLVVLKDAGIWFEIVNLVIPTLNDDRRVARDMCAWIVKDLGSDVPVHFTAFHPTYRLRNLPRTPVSTLREMRRIARGEGVNFAYAGNAPGEEGESTFCPGCGKRVIGRYGYHIVEKNVTRDGKCGGCGREIPGVW